MFNRGEQPATIAVRWSDLFINGLHRVPDLWCGCHGPPDANRCEANMHPVPPADQVTSRGGDQPGSAGPLQFEPPNVDR